MSEEALTIKRNITMIPHICGKEDPWCHFSNLHTSNLSKIFTILLPGAVLSSCGGTLLNSSTIPVSHSSTLDPGRWSHTQDITLWDWGAYKTLLKLPWLMMMVKLWRNFSMDKWCEAELGQCGLQTTAPGAGNHYLARFTVSDLRRWSL